MTPETKEIESKIFDHYTRQLRDRIASVTNVNENEIESSKFEQCVRDVRGRLNIKLKADGICSTLLIHQLGRHRCHLGEIFGDKVEYYNSSEILGLIELIEEGKVKIAHPDNSFKHKPLKGLYKIHHGAYSGLGYSLVRNICEYWYKNTGELHNKRRDDFDTIVKQFGVTNFSAIAQQMHTKAVIDKEKLTGEWLVIHQKERKNYFLCLATHDEGDANIFDNKIRNCIDEFPTELSEIGV
jgi:hypothetical protein